MTRVRFDYTLLRPENPFEIDNGNRPHLYKHLPTDNSGQYIRVGVDDICEAYLDGCPRFYEADEQGDAHWLMLAYVPGLVICVPVLPAHSGKVSECRPIGLYKTAAGMRTRYLRDIR